MVCVGLCNAIHTLGFYSFIAHISAVCGIVLDRTRSNIFYLYSSEIALIMAMLSAHFNTVTLCYVTPPRTWQYHFISSISFVLNFYAKTLLMLWFILTQTRSNQPNTPKLTNLCKRFSAIFSFWNSSICSILLIFLKLLAKQHKYLIHFH